MHRKPLDDVIEKIGETYREDISEGSRNYVEVSIGQQAEMLGLREIQKKYRDVYAVIPLKEAVAGMKVRIDGRTFVNYAQFESGIAMPGYVIKDTGLAHKTFVPNDSMILNCA